MNGWRKLDDDVTVAPQLLPAAMAEAKAAGFRSVINNRPDLEGGPEQPTASAMQAAAEAAGLEYAYQPVLSHLQTPDDAARFAELVKTMPRPVLAFCRSGTRSGNLWQLARSSGAL